MTVFGRDYDTPDGTCIRDYIHVVDLASAHEKALQKLVRDGGRYACNLGTGQGYSVAEVIEATERITGHPITVAEKPRRSGDPARLVADPQTARDLIGWEPRLSALDTIIGHAWAWERKCAGLSAITDPLGSIGR
jgi:UDP-glucose 4-epimerase